MVPWYLIACSLISPPGIQRPLCLLVTPIAVIIQITIIMVREGGTSWRRAELPTKFCGSFDNIWRRRLLADARFRKEVNILNACRKLWVPSLNIVKFREISLTPRGWAVLAREDVGLVSLPPMSRVTRPSHGCHDQLRDRAAAGRQSNWLLMITLSGLRKLLAWLFHI